MPALGIKAKSLFSGFSPLKRLQRKARPAGKRPNKTHKLTKMMPYVRFKTSYRPALGEHCREKY